MKRLSLSPTLALVLLFAPVSLAQEPPPSGPAEVMERAREGRERPSLPPDHPALPSDHPALPSDHPALPPVTEESVQIALSGTATAHAEPDESLSAGTILVRVLDARDEPVANERVRLGIMRADGSRSETFATTNDEGVARFEALATGVEQSYRPSIEAEGARVSTEPFRIEPDRGQRVELRRLLTTRDARFLLQALASTQLEFRQPGRVRVTQGARLLNPTTHVYVFPEAGHAVRLPEGAMAFQSRPTMSDQRMVPTDEGFRIEGSVPPGYHELVWAYDLPLRGEVFELEMPIAFKSTMGHRVVVDQVEGMTFEVEGMTQPFTHEMGGKRLLLVERRMKATEFPLERLRVRLSGLPAEGSLKWWAVWISFGLVLLGLLALRAPGRRLAGAFAARDAESARLVEAIRDLDKQHADGSIGPEYHRSEREAKLAELAELLGDEDRERD